MRCNGILGGSNVEYTKLKVRINSSDYLDFLKKESRPK